MLGTPSSPLPPDSLAERLDAIASPFMLTEFAVAVCFMALAFALPRLGSGLAMRVESWGSRMAARPLRAVLLVGLLAIAARAALLPWLGAPPPVVHDEQSLILQAQTYLAGRLANPTHPFWEHFETFHVNQVPAYASMYFPGRGAPLAAGLLLADNAWVGVWLSFVLMCMAAVWMLQGWVSLPLALLGGVLVVLRFGVFSYWVNSYWGGAFTALGAMLVIGAAARVIREPRWRHGLLLGVGAAILMTTRSYEGMLLCLPVTVWLLVHLLRGQAVAWGRTTALVKTGLPAVVLVASGGALLLAYNAATTGHLIQTPYTLNRLTYSVAPAFLMAPPVQSQQRGPAYFRDFYEEEAKNYFRRDSSVKVVGSVAGKIFHTWNFFVGFTFVAALVAGSWASRRDRFLLGAGAFFLAGYALETWSFPHYAAPLFPLMLIVMLRGFGQLRGWTPRGRPVGVALTRAMPVAAAVVLLLPASSVVTGTPQMASNRASQVCCAIGHDDVRGKVIRRLEATPGPDLVLVRVGPNNPLHYEMVYNEPDIDRAGVVFAHQLGGARDAALVRYFAGRNVWLFEWRPDLPTLYTLRQLPATTQASQR